MSFNSGNNPNVVKTALDDVWDTTFGASSLPGLATAQDASVFQQDTADSSAVIMELFGGVGDWEATAEEQDLPEGNPRVTNQKTFTVTKFAKMIKVPVEFFDDNKHQAYEKMVRNFARRAMTTRDKNAMAIFRNGFTTATTADGAALFSNTHTTVSGATVDNLLTAALSDASLETAINGLIEQQAQDGEIDGHMPGTLLLPPALFKEGQEITKSELRSGTGNNDLNYYSQIYPGLQVKQSPYLGTAAGGSDTAWYLLSPDHAVTRWVRQAATTSLVDFNISDNDVYKYKGRFREVIGAMSYEGSFGSTGAG